MPPNTEVNISPSANIFLLFERLNYKPWTALAEFVDNSLQSFVNHKDALRASASAQTHVTVCVSFDADSGEITVRDDAAGISIADYPRAFRIATPPPDPSGLNEFGMGMKCAAFWFGPRWVVRSSSILDGALREIELDRRNIIANQLERLPVREIPNAAGGRASHGTEITLMDVGRRMPRTQTVQKIREFLGDIYRVPIRQNQLRLIVAGEQCGAFEHQVLRVPRCLRAGEPAGESMLWRKDVAIQLPGGRVISGFAAILAEGKRSHAGFTLFRRGRVVDGFPGARWMPEVIFGAKNSFESMRLFGELHFDGFSVSSQKDQIDWDGFEEDAIDLLRDHIDQEPLPLIRQARLHRVSQHDSADLVKQLAEATDRTGESLAGVSEVTPEVLAVPQEEMAAQPRLQTAEKSLVLKPRSYRVSHNGTDWVIQFQFVNQGDARKWIDVRGASEDLEDSSGVRLLQISILITHPFMRNCVRGEAEYLEPVLRLAAALALAERFARDAGVQTPATIRARMNRLLTDVLGHSPEER